MHFPVGAFDPEETSENFKGEVKTKFCKCENLKTREVISKLFVTKNSVKISSSSVKSK